MKSSMMFDVLILVVTLPRLLACGIKVSTLVFVAFATLSSVVPFVPSARLGWLLFKFSFAICGVVFWSGLLVRVNGVHGCRLIIVGYCRTLGVNGLVAVIETRLCCSVA